MSEVLIVCKQEEYKSAAFAPVGRNQFFGLDETAIIVFVETVGFLSVSHDLKVSLRS